MAEGDYREMPRVSVKHYQEVMRAIVSHYGSITRALDKIDISDHAYYKLMRDDMIVKSVAQKVMDGYTAMKNTQRNDAIFSSTWNNVV